MRSLFASAPFLILATACRGPAPTDSAPAADSVAPTVQDSAAPQDSASPSDTGDTAAPLEPSTSLLQLPGGAPKNLLIVSVDTLRRDHVGFYAGGGTTPNLDGVLAESVVLQDLRGCSNWTYSSLLCLFSGRSTVDLGAEPVTNDPQAAEVPYDTELMPLWLSEAGFRTVSVTGSPFLSDDTGTVTGRWFDRVVYDDWGSSSDFPTGDWTVDQALVEAESLMAEPDERFYLHVHFMDPHSPFAAPDSYRAGLTELDPIPYDLTNASDYGQAQRDYNSLSTEEKTLLISHMDVYYRGDVMYMDEQLGRLWQGLDELGALEDTLVLFWSDHGEQYWEHHQVGHGASLYQEENRALGAFWARGLDAASLSMPAAHQDLTPTLMEALGLPLRSEFTGLPLQDISADRVRFGFRYNIDIPARFMATAGDQALLYSSDGKKFFYDVDLDPEELVDLYSAKDPELRALWDALDPEIDRVAAYLPHLDFKKRGP